MSHSSLREHDNVADRIRLDLQARGGAAVLVEGPDDELVLGRHLKNARAFPCDGKLKVLRALHDLAHAPFIAIGVVDRDFDDEATLRPLGGRVLPYEGRDLEHMLIALGVLAIVLQHQGSVVKIGREGGAARIVQRLLESVEPVARLRLANTREGWGLNFSDVDLAAKIDKKTLRLNVTAYCDALLAKSQVKIDRRCLVTVANEPVSLQHGVRGKDVVAAAGVALRALVGTLPAAAAKEELLVAQLHSSCALDLAGSRWLGDLNERLAINVPH